MSAADPLYRHIGAPPALRDAELSEAWLHDIGRIAERDVWRLIAVAPRDYADEDHRLLAEASAGLATLRERRGDDGMMVAIDTDALIAAAEAVRVELVQSFEALRVRVRRGEGDAVRRDVDAASKWEVESVRYRGADPVRLAAAAWWGLCRHRSGRARSTIAARTLEQSGPTGNG